MRTVPSEQATWVWAWAEVVEELEVDEEEAALLLATTTP